jgi:hypothetical protein
MAGNELALVGGAINASTVSEALTPQLEEALLRASDAKEAARKIAANPKLLAEAMEKMSLVSRLAAPVTADQLYVCLQPLLILHGPPDFGQDEEAEQLQQAWLDIYTKALCQHPKEALEIAVSECIRLRKYNDFPKPGYLNELAQAASDEIRLIDFRLKLAVRKSEEHKPPPKRTPEEALAVKAMVEEMKGPDGRISLGKSVDAVVPPSNRNATAEALRRLADYQ